MNAERQKTLRRFVSLSKARSLRIGSLLLLVALVLGLFATQAHAAANPHEAAAPTPSQPTSFTPGYSTSPASGKRLFSNASPWNVPIGTDVRLDPNSSTMVDELTGGTHVPSLFDYGMPIYTGRANDPLYTVQDSDATFESYQPIHIPDSAAPSPGSDHWLFIYDQTKNLIFEMWQASKNGDTWSANAGEVYSPTGDGVLQPDGSPQPGNGASYFGGVITHADIERGYINHALALISQYTSAAFRYPMHRSDGGGGDIPMGARFQLDPSVDCQALPDASVGEKMICQALETYGGYMRDTGGVALSMYFEGEDLSDPNRNPPGGSPGDGGRSGGIYGNVGLSDHTDLSAIPWEKLRVLKSWDSFTPLASSPSPTATPQGTPASFPVPPAGEPYNPPVPATALGYPASDGNILWDGGFETGDFRQYRIENWGNLDGGGWGNSSGTLVTSPVEHGSYSLKMTVNPPDSPTAANRAQISTSNAQIGASEGNSYYYSFGLYIPSQPNKTSGWPDWTNISQWFGGCYPMLQLYINASGQYVVESQPNDPSACNGNGPTQEWVIGNVAYDTWEDFTFHITWSADPSQGSVTVWHDGKLALPTKAVQTLENNAPTWDLQVYRDGGKTNIVYFDSARVHTAYAPASPLVPQPSPTPTPAASPVAGMAPVGQSGNWKMIFHDEFTGSVLDTTRWATCFTNSRIEGNYCTHDNGELELYTPQNVSEANGTLALSARQEDVNAGGRTFHYTSGMISSDPAAVGGNGGFTFTYGYAEMRAKIPAGQGLWPAFWTLPADGSWPPEIDMFEFLGNAPNVIQMHYHYPGDNGGDQADGTAWTGPDFSAGWHTFGIDWEPGSLTWYVDGVARFHTGTSVTSKPMYLLANLAVGGDWPGNPDATTPFPATFQIDYIRVWQH